jgi:hypothetical protein
VQNQIQQGPVDFNVAVIGNESELAEFVHEKTDARARGADHLRQRLLADFRQDRFGIALLAEVRKKQEFARDMATVYRIPELSARRLRDSVSCRRIVVFTLADCHNALAGER